MLATETDPSGDLWETVQHYRRGKEGDSGDKKEEKQEGKEMDRRGEGRWGPPPGHTGTSTLGSIPNRKLILGTP